MDSSVDISMGLYLPNTYTTTTFENFSNLSLIGYNNATIDCNFLRSLHFKYCSNITIENITWINCGSDINHRPLFLNVPDHWNHVHHNLFNFYNYGIKLDTCSNVYLKNCTFIASKVGILAASGVVHIDQVNFLSSAYNIVGDLTSMFAIVNEADMISNNVTVKITNSLFSTMGNIGLLIFYIFVDNSYATVQFNIIFEDTNFTHLSYDPSPITESIMQMILSTKISVTFNKVQITSNHFTNEFTGHKRANILSIDFSGYENTVKIQSCNFLNNTANVVLRIQGDMYLDIIDSNFSNNNVNTIFVSASSIITNGFKIVQVVVQNSFLNNIGGHLISLNGTYVVAIVTELQIINNTLSSGYNSLLLFHNYTVLVASFNEVKYEYNIIPGRSSGFYFVSKFIPKVITPHSSFFTITSVYHQTTCKL